MAHVATAADAAQARKLRIPRLSSTVFRRDRVASLIENASAYPVTVVKARAGAGKTMACATWAVAAARPRRVAWLTLDEGDRSPARFWANVTAALSADSIPSDQPLIPRSRDAADDLTASLMNAVRGVGVPTVLVLDNMQELADSGVLPELGYLVRHAPPTLRLILSGRYMPGLQLAKMRLAGDLAEITETDLACTPDEADGFVTALGLAADEAERDALLRDTEGWVAGLRMAAQAAGPSPGAGYGGLASATVVADYLHDEVLDRQSSQVQLFMRRTSVAKRLTGELADQLTGEPGGAFVLDRLHRQNNFVDRDSDGHYRYHPCLRATLLAELRQWQAAEVPVLFGRAARWHAASGEAVEAMACAAEADDWGFASQALAEVGIAGLLPDRAAELEEVLAGFPASLRTDDPVIAAALAAARLCDGDPECAAVYLDCAQRAIDDGEPAPVIELWLAALRVMRAACSPDADRGTIEAGQEQAEKAQAAASTVQAHQALGLLWLVLGTAWLGRWELTEARSALGRAEHQLTAANLTGLRTRTRGWRALAEAFYGDLVAAADLVAQVRASVPADPAGECFATLAAGWLALERDDLDTARQLLDDAGTATATARRLPGEPDAEALRTMIKASVALAAGDATAARGLVTLGRGADPDLAALSALDADIALRTGDIARASAFAAPERQPRSVVRSLAHARVLLADGDSAGALDEASACLDGPGAVAPTLREQITALLTAAAASRRLGAADATAELLERALLIAEPHDAYRPFLDAGSGIHSAIAVLVPPTSPVASFAARVVERFVCQLPVTNRDQGAPEYSPLTSSEVAVLRLLPSYLTNQEIAEQLFLSVNTVKTHLRSAYHKLGVTSRREAIARGRRLRLLLAGRGPAGPAGRLAGWSPGRLVALARLPR
jgi:LuxR family transcriptional regulator, maltose regulon positive regulatory protein